MAKKKRWGKTFVDTRDWKVENEKYVVRGMFLLDLEWIKSWDKEIAEMNRGKCGAPYEFPESLIRFLAILQQWVNVRGLEGICRRLCRYTSLPKYCDFSTICRRINKIDTAFILPTEGDISAATDGTGFKMTSRGEYKETLYGDGKKKYLKVTTTSNSRGKKLLDIDVSVDGEGDSEPEVAMSHLESLVRLGYTIEDFGGDGAFDVHALFDLLDQYGIRSGIKIRKNASVDEDGNGSWRRRQEVLKYRKKDYRKWAKDAEYGMRWPGTEGIFSAVKRIFGEGTKGKNIKTMAHELKRRFWAYDRMCNYAEA
ncbi:TPA: IS5 family transposase [Candidatus Woesearchaeota archaeon]|nr:IS5 family transposase [Candidatus Woesearchaeota archaeon]